jgi:outer membrane protein TolC
MSRLWPLLSALLIVLFSLLIVWSDRSDAAQALTLVKAVQIALERNLTMADSRLAVTEKEYQRREALSDFFPLAITQYNGIVDRYSHPYPFKIWRQSTGRPYGSAQSSS